MSTDRELIERVREAVEKMTPKMRLKRQQLGDQDFYWQIWDEQRELAQTIVQELPYGKEWFERDEANMRGFVLLRNSAERLLELAERAVKHQERIDNCYNPFKEK